MTKGYVLTSPSIVMKVTVTLPNIKFMSVIIKFVRPCPNNVLMVVNN